MPIGTTAAILGAAGISTAVSAIGASKAAGAQKKTAQAALSAEERMYSQSREDLSPWREAGQSALAEYAGQIGIPGYKPQSSFTASPGYDFRLKQGEKSVNQAAGVRGMLRSGTRLKALNDYGQNMASEEYDKWMNKLAAVSGIGQSTATTQAGQNAGSASQRADLLGQQGAARASGYAGVSNAINSGLNNLAGFAGQQGWLKSYYNQPDMVGYGGAF